MKDTQLFPNQIRLVQYPFTLKYPESILVMKDMRNAYVRISYVLKCNKQIPLLSQWITSSFLLNSEF